MSNPRSSSGCIGGHEFGCGSGCFGGALDGLDLVDLKLERAEEPLDDEPSVDSGVALADGSVVGVDASPLEVVQVRKRFRRCPDDPDQIGNDALEVPVVDGERDDLVAGPVR